MNLDDLVKMGAVVSTDTVEVPVEWEGHKFTAHVRKLSYGDYEAMAGMDETSSKGATIISKCLFLPDKARLMTYEEAYQLKPTFAQALIEAITTSKAIASPKP
jgi:hypothetical protein